MKKAIKTDLKILITLVIIGQLVFFLMSPGLTRPNYISRIYATTGVRHKQEDLHKLNEAAHYFGQTMIGWLKFPNFMNKLNDYLEAKPLPKLPMETSLSAHMQERQNIIFVLTGPQPLETLQVAAVKDYLQTWIDQYNASSQTEFTLTNVDYEQLEERKSYKFGAMVTLLVTFVIGVGVGFIRREL